MPVILHWLCKLIDAVKNTIKTYQKLRDVHKVELIEIHVVNYINETENNMKRNQ